MLVLGPGSTHLVMAANLWPWYDHIESCVALKRCATKSKQNYRGTTLEWGAEKLFGV